MPVTSSGYQIMVPTFTAEPVTTADVPLDATPRTE